MVDIIEIKSTFCSFREDVLFEWIVVSMFIMYELTMFEQWTVSCMFRWSQQSASQPPDLATRLI